MNARILVVGATGTVGRPLVAELVKGGMAVRAATRDPARARGVLPEAAEIVPFDLERTDTFDDALHDVDRVFLMARPGDEHADHLAFPLIEAMERHGVRHVVDLSALGAEARPSFALRKVEQRIEASPMTFTHLRPNFFMQLFTGGSLLAAVRASAIRVPAALAKVSWIDARDVAAVAAAVLVSDLSYAGKAYTLTGSQALDHAELAAVIEQVSGRTVRYEAIGEEEARRVLSGAGFPAPWVERLIGFYRLVRDEAAAPVSSAVQDLLGRPARTFSAFACEHAAMWRG
ncbi:NAD(P)H-binding protein [Xanthobacteraceae bacterium Astr-EGSB]|uniref:NmrA family NAD(P)-binding protein n=1 Tax=Astrobacterium formosum TaxID=3069710 RepID=UPI0027B50F94|nr:NAD(P)H-binding protein [Xanthobacteraceae bacterium Astr-EGSB]